MNGNFTRKMHGFEQIIQFGAKLRIFLYFFSNNLKTGLRDLDFNKNFRDRVMIRAAIQETVVFYAILSSFFLLQNHSAHLFYSTVTMM